MKYELKTNHVLFRQLEEKPPLWWRNLKSDPQVYIDIRKKNYINAYHNGGSIIKFTHNNLILRWDIHRPRYSNIVAYLFLDAGVWNRNNICAAYRVRISISVPQVGPVKTP
jgi:hypothetical protein